MDGTVLDSNKQISQENIDAFKFCAQKGIEVVPVTGRPYAGLYDEYKKAIGCNYSIHTNGARVVNVHTDEAIITHTLSSKTIDEIVSVLSYFDCYYSVFYKGLGYLSADKYNYELNRYFGTPLHDYIKITRRPVENQFEFIRSISACDNIYVNAKNTYIRDEICKAIEDIKDIFFTCSDVDDVEIGGDCSKGKSMLELAHKLGIQPDEIMAIGDGGNDLNMLQMAGVAVAMGNAPDNIKEASDFVTDICDNNGVAVAIRKFCG